MRLALTLVFAATSAAWAGPSGEAPGLLRDWAALNSACRGGRGDDPATLEACARRDALDRRLTAAGWCYGRPGDAGYQRTWRSCAEAGRLGARE
ncbi:hypothetical protein VQ02_06015 [Methylobacterium variabile]|jgi:hypothetical protein|uniref:Uncharacterized protein n=1 Tax=Methylobacterium variabile TaxID=298794 RepID=A0A0J6T5R8_9HYPH|nr:hypothetical protein [Methylobacterium variabile]KMO41299.1 hypothetical protein VQ02_06015 [Methylobacterium variabile]